MTIVKLNHPKHGLVSQMTIKGALDKEAVEGYYRNRYGEKMQECTIEYETHLKTSIISKQMGGRRIQNIRTGEVYESRHEAKKALGLSTHQLYSHLYRRLKREWYYKVRWI